MLEMLIFTMAVLSITVKKLTFCQDGMKFIQSNTHFSPKAFSSSLRLWSPFTSSCSSDFLRAPPPFPLYLPSYFSAEEHRDHCVPYDFPPPPTSLVIPLVFPVYFLKEKPFNEKYKPIQSQGSRPKYYNIGMKHEAFLTQLLLLMTHNI